MAIWSAEIKELERLNVSLIGHFPELEKEMGQLVKTEDENVAMLYSRRCLEIIVTDLCECELKRPRKTEPLKGIIDKLNKEEKVASYIVTSMHGLNSLSTYGAHPKDFDPEQVKPALNNLAIILKWYLKYKGIEILGKPLTTEEKEVISCTGEHITDITRLEKSVAILPFRNDSKDEENTYFINGLMEEVLNNLQKIKDLRVISRTSVEQYRNQTKPIPEIAKELGVNYIVEGSGQKYGNAFRLRTQLIIAAKESHLWGESYQQKISDAEDIFRIQSQIAKAIATELNAIITPKEKQLIEKIPTKEYEAFDAYLKGQFHWKNVTANDMDIAMKYFELAKEKDPNYALAYAGICDVWIGRQQMGIVPPSEAGPKAFEAAMKAVELDSNRSEVHYSLALMYTWGMWNWEAGEAAFKKSILINPNHAEAHAYYSHFLNSFGRQTEAMEHINCALMVDPINPLIIGIYAMDLYFIRQYDDVVKTALKALEMDSANFVALVALASAFYSLGKYEEAIDAWNKYYSSLYGGINHIFNQKRTECSYKQLMELEADTITEQLNNSYILPVDIGQLYIMGGNYQKALDWLEKGFEERDPNMAYIRVPMFDPLREEPRFQEIARKMNLPYK